MSNAASEFRHFVLDRARTVEKGVVPVVRYDPDGDCVEFVFSDDDYTEEPIDHLVTVHYGRRSGEIVGSTLTGICRFLREKAPGLRVSAQGGRVRLDHILRFAMWAREGKGADAPVRIYKKLIAQAEEAKAEVKLATV